MKRYPLFYAPVLSFFSKKLYRDVCHRGKGVGFFYLLVLLAVCWIPFFMQMQQGLANFVDNEAPKMVSQIPKITILNGRASIAEPQPYYIRDQATDAVLFIIDTTGSLSSLADTEAVGLMTQTQAIFKKSTAETRTYSFSEIDKFTLEPSQVMSWLAVLKKYAAPSLYLFFLLGSFISRIIQILIYAAIGLFISSLCKVTRTYPELLRLTVVAVTPCILMKTLLGVLQIAIPFAGIWYLFIAMGYLTFGIKATIQTESTFSIEGHDEFED